MQELYQISAKIAGYFGCVAIGALVSWYITKKHYEKIVDEEVESIREVQERRAEESVSKHIYEDIVEPYVFNDEHPRDDRAPEPYLIPMETFDDADPAYEKISLEYYTDNKCLVENDSVINADESVGFKNLERFDKRMDLMIMYVRNEKTSVDYEVTKIIDAWEG